MFTVIGTANVDLHVDTPAHPRQEGDEFTADSLVFCEAPLRARLGGNGANSAYALARLGVPVRLGSAIGRDQLGSMVLGWLEHAGVETSAVARSDAAATSSTTIITDPARSRFSYHHRGPFSTFGPDELPPRVLESADGILLSSYPLLLGWRSINVVTSFAELRRRGGLTALDVGPAVEPHVRLRDLGEVLPLVDFLFCNEHELCALAETEDVEEAVALVRAAGPGHLVLKRGPAGAAVFGPSRADSVHVPAFSVPIHSTVGAGDAFNAGFLCGVLRGRSLQDAVVLGHAVAGIVVSSSDGILASPVLAEADKFIAVRG